MIGAMDFIYFYSTSNESFDTMFLPCQIKKIEKDSDSKTFAGS